MIKNTQKYEYKQVEEYKEVLELQHIKFRTYLVNAMTLIFAIVLTVINYRLDVGAGYFYSYIAYFVLFFFVNILLFSFSNDLYNNLKIAMYFNTLAIFTITGSLVIVFQTPSIFTGLFLAYAIIFIYQDYKVMILSNFLIFIFGTLLVMNFPNILDIPNNSTPQVYLILVFLFVFVLLLALSSYILIKRKVFFYNQLAQIRESEIRNIDILDELKWQRSESKQFDVDTYYDCIDVFTEELSKKLDIDNVFKRKIKLLKDLEFMTLNQINEKYPEFTNDQIKKIKLLEFNINHKMRNLSIKASKLKNVEVHKHEMFSESQFKSFNHFEDSNYVKIISFVVFYVLIKLDKPYLNELEEQLIKDVLLNSKYFYNINRDILKIYLENNAVFDTVVEDILKDGETDESTS